MLSVTVRYFARLRELRGLASEEVAIDQKTTADDLYLTLFPDQGTDRLRVGYAINKSMVPGNTELRAGDEIAFIPPVGGG